MEKGNHLAKNKLDQDSKLNDIQALDVDIILGNPKYNCRYNGICEIQPSNTFGHHSEHPDLSITKAKIFLNRNGELEILFKKKTISDRTKRLHFSERFFIISESINIPVFLSDFLKTPYTIHAGKHFINRGSGYYKIAFKRESHDLSVDSILDTCNGKCS